MASELRGDGGGEHDVRQTALVYSLRGSDLWSVGKLGGI